MASLKHAARDDLENIWRHQFRYDGLEYADGIVAWLLDLSEQIEASRCPLLTEDTRKYVRDGYVFVIRQGSEELEIIGVFGPGQDWTSWVKGR